MMTIGDVLNNKRKQPPKKMWRGSTRCDFHTDCDVTTKKWFVDGKTFQGPWALMCPTAYAAYGIGLGTGRGQKYDGKTRQKIEG